MNVVVNLHQRDGDSKIAIFHPSETEQIELKVKHVLDNSNDVIEALKKTEHGPVALAFNTDSESFLKIIPCILALQKLSRPFFIIDSKNQDVSKIPSCIKTILHDRYHMEVSKMSLNCSTKIGDDLFLSTKLLKSSKTHVSVPDDVLYIVQTSGSTGERKTVYVTPSSILPNVKDFLREFERVNDIFVASPPTFDPFFVDLYFGLYYRKVIHFTPPSIKTVPSKLKGIIHES